MARQVSTSRKELECMLVDEASKPGPLPLSLLEDITNGFSDDHEIGRGAFAVVYKGTLNNGLTVAVKRLLHSYMHEKEFQREVECLLKVKHTNIVRFLGYCADTQGNMANCYGKAVMADVQQKLLCFDFLPKGSLDQYIQDASSGLEWSKRYRIIKGVCEGLSYLHQEKIMHLDLKPANILLDANMVPKISDFGISRILEEDENKLLATKVGGTLGYLAPEFTSNEITPKYDLYSLGVILIELLTGKKRCQNVDTVLESWSNRLDKSQGDTSFEQIRVCTEIGIECVDMDPEKRPASIHHIVNRLKETESSQVKLGSSELLDIQPLVLRFPFEPNKYIRCSLQLTNNTAEHVLFRLMNNNANQPCIVRLPLFGIVPPRSAYTLFVTTDEQEKLPEHKYFDLILESSILGDEHDCSSETYKSDGFFEETKRMGGMVHEVTLKAVCTLQPGITTSEVLHVEIPYKKLRSFDMHPTKKWIIVGQDDGRIRIWNYETQKLVGSFKVSWSQVVVSIKFIEREKWFVAGTNCGFIHVYCYDTMKKIRSFRSNTEWASLKTLVVHPTQSYILTVLDNCYTKLWDWNRGWECIQTFMMEYNDEYMFVFNPMDITIASASRHTVKIWGPDSAEPKYNLSGHSENVNSLDFFTSNYQKYLITGSDDCTAKIWDMQKRMCVRTLQPFMSSVISVISSPNLPILITGSRDGTVHLWNSANFRVEAVFQTCITTDKHCISFGIDARRVIIQHDQEISFIYIDNIGCETGSTYSCAQQLNAESILGNKTLEDPNVCAQEKSMEVDDISEVISTSTLLDVHPMPGSLELINNRDECVAFRVMGKGGMVPAKSTYTLIWKHRKGAILESSISGDKYVPFMYQSECDEYFKEAKEMGNAVHELVLEDIFARQGGTTSPAITPINKIIEDVENHDLTGLCALDAHPTDPLILTSHKNNAYGSEVRLWKYNTPAKEMLCTVTGKTTACSVKFVPQKQWFIAGTDDGFIHVYSYGRDIQKITSFKSHDSDDIRLAVHPTQSYVISLSVGLIKLWDWNKSGPDFIKKYTGWKCLQTIEAGQFSRHSPVAFNPKGINCFVVALKDYTIKVWNLDSPRSMYILSGHSGKVKCLAFFERDDQHYLISGALDCTAKIWDLKRKTCVHTLRAFTSPVISGISLHDLPYIILSSQEGIIYIWNSRNSRLERMVSWGRSEKAALYLMASRRVVIERRGRISFMDIDN